MSRRSSPKPRLRSLYDRLGGIFPIAAIVDDFSDALLDNPLVGRDSPNPHLRRWSRRELRQPQRLPGLKWLRTLWLASLAGGPYEFVGTKPGACPFGLERAHTAFKITSVEFNTVANELALALDRAAVPPREKQQVLAAFAQHKPEVTQHQACPHSRNK